MLGLQQQAARGAASNSLLADSAISSWVALSTRDWSPKLARILSSHKQRLAKKLLEWEQATAAVVCSVTDTRSGQVGP